MASWSRVKRARRKAESSALCWPICFCTMLLIDGWRSGIRSCRLNVSPMMPSCIAPRRTYPNEKFDFLGYTFRPRRSKNRNGKHFINFSPAVSDKAVKAIRAEIRGWNLHLRSDKSIEDLSRMFNPIIRGWLQYYGRYYRSRSIRRCGNWIDRWPAGPIGNTRSCAGICAGRRIGSRVSRDAIRSCGRTGRWVCGGVPWREPYELRGSSTVLRELGGEIPRPTHPICHCQSEAKALELRQALEKRFAECRLQLYPQKTKVVYCKDANRPGEVSGAIVRLSWVYIPSKRGCQSSG